MKRLIKRILLVGVGLVAAASISLWWGYRQSRKVPEFYQRAISTSRTSTAEVVQSSEKMQARVEQLQADVEQAGIWEAAFAEDQINAWLIDQMPRYLKMLQSKGVQDPQIKIEEGNLIAAALVKSRRFEGVVSCDIGIQMTDQPNCLAIKINSIYAGALPIPLVSVQDGITKIFAKSSLNLRWDNHEGETVALIDIPQKYSGMDASPVIVEFLELTDGRISFAGRSGEGTLAEFEPRGSIYKIASVKDHSENSIDFSIPNVHRDSVSLD
ncbi:hypothetical protein [Rhodopirellula sp. MGV]|uniref:hypothetical protein n=1 Tax=Rhodopirellula sp. MGV TaxID=2023130 RepID=UPI000B970CE8|nr:hypothetical protein [Rhodopirellula sp. MGV]OYP38396.1 hypothetical protein CGZ80_02300 [Rhodopirellula sp. MGV]PNY34184.1 hypothetical protein C2E31_24530 [Rhodopirellula baltica]